MSASVATQAPTRVPCNLCGVDDVKIVHPAGTAQAGEIVRCNRCGLMYVCPRPEADVDRITKWADDPSFDPVAVNPLRHDKEKCQVRDYRWTVRCWRAVTRNAATWSRSAAPWASDWPPGATRGGPCAAWIPIKTGAATVGALRAHCQPTTLEDIGLPSASVDVCVFLHVIEHLPDPLQTLREIHRILRPGGRLVIETPRYDTLMYRLLGRRERSLRCSGHCYFFTTQTLQKLYDAAGFSPSESITSGVAFRSSASRTTSTSSPGSAGWHRSLAGWHFIGPSLPECPRHAAGRGPEGSGCPTNDRRPMRSDVDGPTGLPAIRLAGGEWVVVVPVRCAWADEKSGLPCSRSLLPLPKVGRPERNRGEHQACTCPTFHQPRVRGGSPRVLNPSVNCYSWKE